MKKHPILLTAMIALSTSMTGFAATGHHNNGSDQFSPQQVKNIEQVVHNYLVKNPQVLVEASQALQAQEEQKAQTSAMAAVKENKAQLFDNKYSPSKGNANAAVTVVEFFDYQCGHCRAMTPVMMKVADTDKNVRFVFKELPIFGGVSKFAAEAALAAQEQGKYYPFHNALLNSDGPLSEQKVMDMAKKMGLNVSKLKKDMKSAKVTQEIQANFKLAQSLKIMGTPTFVLSNKAQTDFRYIPGATSLDNLQKQIKALQ